MSDNNEFHDNITANLIARKLLEEEQKAKRMEREEQLREQTRQLRIKRIQREMNPGQ